MTKSEHMSEQVTSSDVRSFMLALTQVDGVGCTDAERVDLLRALEELKGSAAAAQAKVTVAFDISQRQEQRDAGVGERRIGQGVAAQVALARRESPHRGSRHLGLAHALVDELPHTLAALESGETSEWRAMLVARETACLSREDRRAVDAGLASRTGASVHSGTPPWWPRPGGSATGSTRTRSPTALPASTPTAGSRCDRRRTPWRCCPGCCPPLRASLSTPP